MKDFRGHPPHVPTTSTSPQTLPYCHSSPTVARLAESTRGFRRVLGHQTVSAPRTRFLFGTLCTSLKLHPVVSVANKAYSVCDSAFDKSLQVLVLLLESSPLLETLRPAEAPRTFSSTKVRYFSSLKRNSSQVCASLSCWTSFAASRQLRCSPSSYHSSATMRKFCLLCDTIDDQRSSTRRLHDVDNCANDLRLDMAHLSQCGLSVLMDVKLTTTENKRAFPSNCALASTSL